MLADLHLQTASIATNRSILLYQAGQLYSKVAQMRMILFVSTLLLNLFVSGCAPLKPLVMRPSNGYSQAQWNSYDQALAADYTLDIRTHVLDPKAPLIEGIQKACLKGVQVNVLLYVGGRHTASALAGTCAAVYISDYPDLQYAKIVMLLDGNFLVVNGMLRAIRTKDTQQEYFFQRQERMISQRVQ
jgi:hypothetical protein